MKTRTKWVIALALAVGSLWLIGLFYVLTFVWIEKLDYISNWIVFCTSKN